MERSEFDSLLYHTIHLIKIYKCRQCGRWQRHRNEKYMHHLQSRLLGNIPKEKNKEGKIRVLREPMWGHWPPQWWGVYESRKIPRMRNTHWMEGRLRKGMHKVLGRGAVLPLSVMVALDNRGQVLLAGWHTSSFYLLLSFPPSSIKSSFAAADGHMDSYTTLLPWFTGRFCFNEEEENLILTDHCSYSTSLLQMLLDYIQGKSPSLSDNTTFQKCDENEQRSLCPCWHQESMRAILYFLPAEFLGETDRQTTPLLKPLNIHF